MYNFNNECYETLVNDLITDAFYLKGASRRGIISKIRQYSEIIVRKILNIPMKTKVTLGDHKIEAKIKNKNNITLVNSIKTINLVGNKCIHTQFTEDISDEEYKNVIDSLLYLYAYLLIEYFNKYKFGTNPSIVHKFSILPPIIRYLVLKDLYNIYPKNIFIIDKLALALLKSFDRDTAIKWVEERKDELMNMPSIDESAKNDLIRKLGEEFGNEIISQSPNMYDLCIEKIELVGAEIDKNGKMYNDFESAIEYYRETGEVEGESKDIKDFNDIMNFLYLGRKSYSELVK